VGGGVLLETRASLTGGLIAGNEASTAFDPYAGIGGGILGYGEIAISGVEVAGNTAEYGAGVALSDASAVLTDVSVHDNSAADPYGGGAGGGLFLWGTLENVGTTAFVANDADNAAGAYVSDSSLVGGSFTDNVAVSYGGGIAAISTAAEVSLEDVVVEGNVAEIGGGVLAESSYYDVRIAGARIASNTATLGGGIARNFDWIGAPPIDLDSVEIVDNVAEAGGGIYASYGAFVLTDAVVLRNQADQGGGAMLVDEALLSSVGSDWGADSDDNAPGDVFAGAELVGYGAAAAFDCSAAGCSPSP
jgi:hypothetical protein